MMKNNVVSCRFVDFGHFNNADSQYKIIVPRWSQLEHNWMHVYISKSNYVIVNIL